MLKKNHLKIAVLIASGIVFANTFLLAEDFTATQNNEVTQEEVENGTPTPEDRLCDLEEQVIAIADQLETALGPKSPISPDENSISRGRTLYAKKCRGCHGTQGQGNGSRRRVVKNLPNLSDSSMWDQNDQMLFNVITNGAPKMPSFKNLKEEDRWHLVNYIRTFSPKPNEN